jgi:hypothetical protein
MLLYVEQAFSGMLSLSLQDSEKSKVALAVISIEPLDFNEKPDMQAAGIYIMDQVNEQFSPHILAVPKNALVSFPNSDSIKHHVYSFSDAKTFELPFIFKINMSPFNFLKPG